MFGKGLVQIYTGDGKGKTTAALGLAMRAAGHGARVLIYQFLKPGNLNLGERVFLSAHGTGITMQWLDEPWDMFQARKEQRQLQRIRDKIHAVMQELETAAHEKYYDLMVLDEILFCLKEGLIDLADIKNLIAHRDPHVELVLTGRGNHAKLAELADLVTEMRLVKHPYENGTAARKGIEY